MGEHGPRNHDAGHLRPQRRARRRRCGAATARRRRASVPSFSATCALADLVFVVARHLAYYRPEHYPLVFYPTLPELTTLFFAALKIALPEVPIPAGDAVAKLRKSASRAHRRRRARRARQSGEGLRRGGRTRRSRHVDQKRRAHREPRGARPVGRLPRRDEAHQSREARASPTSRSKSAARISSATSRPRATPICASNSTAKIRRNARRRLRRLPTRSASARRRSSRSRSSSCRAGSRRPERA